MFDKLALFKPRIVGELERFLTLLKADTKKASPWTEDAFSKLSDYVARGKMIRGALVCLSAQIVSGERFGNASEEGSLETVSYRIAGAMELLQSLLLIHDDIMDQDDLRRGKPSIHAQYRQLCQERKIAQAGRLGESLGICLGDVSGFAAFELLASLPVPASLVKDLLLLTSRELSYVGLAQMSDVYNGAAGGEVSLPEIVQLYRYKTGRYTFSLPLMAGALAAGGTQEAKDALGSLGELYGIIFQIKDDELGLFSKSVSIGKPWGSDIRENKKTLHRAYVLERCDVNQRDRLRKIFGNKDADETEIDYVTTLMKELKIDLLIGTEVERYAEEARVLISSFAWLSEDGRTVLEEILEFNLNRAY